MNQIRANGIKDEITELKATIKRLEQRVENLQTVIQKLVYEVEHPKF